MATREDSKWIYHNPLIVRTTEMRSARSRQQTGKNGNKPPEKPPRSRLINFNLMHIYAARRITNELPAWDYLNGCFFIFSAGSIPARWKHLGGGILLCVTELITVHTLYKDPEKGNNCLIPEIALQHFWARFWQSPSTELNVRHTTSKRAHHPRPTSNETLSSGSAQFEK